MARSKPIAEASIYLQEKCLSLVPAPKASQHLQSSLPRAESIVNGIDTDKKRGEEKIEVYVTLKLYIQELILMPQHSLFCFPQLPRCESSRHTQLIRGVFCSSVRLVSVGVAPKCCVAKLLLSALAVTESSRAPFQGPAP